MTFSQRHEDDFIEPLLPEFGHYLDLGAFDGRTFSNTRLVARKGWEGVCVEPAASAFAQLATDAPAGTILVNALIARQRGLTPFHYSKDALSTADDGHARRWAGIAAYTPTFVAAITLGDLLDAFPGPYDLISVDCEGMTLPIVQDLIPHLDELKCRCLIYEHEGTTENISGFTERLRTEENAVLIRD